MFAVTVEEYQLLLKLNQMTTMKYEEMTSFASRLQQSSQTLNDKCKFPSISVPCRVSPLCPQSHPCSHTVIT